MKDSRTLVMSQDTTSIPIDQHSLGRALAGIFDIFVIRRCNGQLNESNAIKALQKI